MTIDIAPQSAPTGRDAALPDTTPATRPETAPAATVPPAVIPTISAEQVRSATGSAIEALAQLDLDDPRRRGVGPLLSALAVELRATLGRTSSTSYACPPVVREADLAAAARPLLRDDVAVVNQEAARRALVLASDVVLALRRPGA